MELDYLVVAAHPDDAEIGLGGTIALLLAQGNKVGVLDLTNGEPTPFGDPGTRQRETVAATAVLGLSWRDNLGLPNRRLEATLEARAALANVFRSVRPRVLFAQYWEDSHPDHVAACQLVEAARFWAKLSKTDLQGQPHYPERILHYFSIHLRLTPQPACIMDVSGFMAKKMQALECYHSQFLAGRATGSPDVLEAVRAQGRYWGWAIRAEYGEPLATRENLGLRGLRDLV